MSGRAGGLVDVAEAAASDHIRRQAEVRNIEDVEELGADLHGAKFGASAAAEGRVFDERDIEIVITGSAKRVATQRS